MKIMRKDSGIEHKSSYFIIDFEKYFSKNRNTITITKPIFNPYSNNSMEKKKNN